MDETTQASSQPSPNPIPPPLAARLRKRRRPTPSPTTITTTTTTTAASTRRQLLLDSRKSLLRARAQHVESVRLARASSHEAVSARLLALQASLSQAQDSRNAILAKIAGSCASEVAKAKRLAGEMRMRREQEARRLRVGVEERMVGAERRRAEVLRGRGGRRGSGSKGESGGKVKGEGKSEEEAARVLQRAWRAYARGLVVKRFLELGISIGGVREARFEEVSRRFQEEGVQRATGRLLELCGLLGGEVERDCRTFLSAFLILGHPAEVLSCDGGEEKALITKSKDLLIAFESFLSSPTFPPAPHLVATWKSFNTAFTTWKARDSEILINTMVAQYAELDLIWQKVKDDSEEHVAADFKEGIRENQLLLLVRIRRLAGERTRGLLRAAVKEARRTRLPKREKGDTKPRETPTGAARSTVSTETATVAAPPTAGTADDTPTPEAFSQFSPTPTAGLTNRQIIHELALNKDFKLSPRPKSPLEELVEREAKRAFWDLMRRDIALGLLEKWIPPMAQSVKSRLLHLLDPAGGLHKAIDTSIDIDLISQQCRAGSYEHEGFFTYILNLLPRICSPARDEEVEKLRKEAEQGGDVIERLQRLFEVLDLMQLDHANFLLMMSARQLIPESAAYERRLFAAELAAGTRTLERTTAWLETARAAMLAAAPEGQRPTPLSIYNHALRTLFATLDTTLLTADTAPETLHLDIDRLNGFRAAFRRIILGAAITLTVKNLLRRDVRGAWKALKERICALGEGELTEGIVAFLRETTATPEGVLGHVGGAVGRIVGKGEGDAVVRVMAGRLGGFIEERMGAAVGKERVRLAVGGGEVLGGWGVGEWGLEVGGFVEGVVVVGEVNRGVYGGWYDGVLVG